jgi:hypothetical protein
MRKALIALMAGGALVATALPALAQSYDPGVARREADIRLLIDDGVRFGDLSGGQASRLNSELREITDLDARYQDEGMSDWQIRDLNSRLALLSSRVHHEINMNRDYNGY